jgi:HTH-type transcriptional regulator, transcriptional repressor of NAD biosynthesis genes
MKRGLVIGKFMPVHKGHLALIDFAANQCDELLVSMSYTPQDPIPSGIRFQWLQQLLQPNPKIKVALSLDDFDDERLPLVERTKIWAAFIKKRFPKIDVLISSELYGIPFAQHLGVPHIMFDQARNQLPVSASLIRQHPLKYWDFIPSVVQPYFVKKICFYGPESTGKSVMVRRFAELYHTEIVPEVAREIVTSNEFTVDDIIKVGKAQTERVIEKTKTANKFLFCDTDLITTQIYCQHYLKTVPPILYELEKQITYEAYFLFDIDVPWIADNLRDLGHKRQEMFSVFEGQLEERNLVYTLVQGDWDNRAQIIKRNLELLLSK